MKMSNEEIKLINDLFKGAIVYFDHFLANPPRNKSYIAGMNGADGLGHFFNNWYFTPNKIVKITKVDLPPEVRKRIYDYISKL